ncbi:MAG TPA: PorP/SprF family type IX secretion system membrane protein [Brumimicrobium sp.]|nr:PorP/SprF family type IX secretion system membrane protein [Brumimicrobium sp.]
MEYNLKKYYSILLVALFVFQVSAQDIHFSQMKFAPLNVNPAAAGLNGKYNAIANYRTQWNSVADPFNTMGASFDMKFDEARRSKGFLAAGINFYHDVAGIMNMTTSNVNLSLAYHLRVSASSTIGLGMQIGYGQRGLGRVDGLYASQYDGNNFNQNIVSGENFGQTNFGFVDAGAGFVFNHNSLSENTFRSNGYNLSIGVGAYHLTKPSYSFLLGGKDDLAMRFTGFVESEFIVSNSTVSLMPALYYQRQGTHQEFLVGTYIKLAIIQSSSRTSLREGFSIAYGPFYRFGDAFVNKLLIDYGGYALGISYDLNISSLTQASKGRGGVEFMFRYSLKEKHQTRARIH